MNDEICTYVLYTVEEWVYGTCIVHSGGVGVWDMYCTQWRSGCMGHVLYTVEEWVYGTCTVHSGGVGVWDMYCTLWRSGCMGHVLHTVKELVYGTCVQGGIHTGLPYRYTYIRTYVCRYLQKVIIRSTKCGKICD